MLFLLGLTIVSLSVIGGFMLSSGQLGSIWQPTEVLIICGAALGSFIIANPGSVIIDTMRRLPYLLLPRHSKTTEYLDLLALLYQLLGKLRQQGEMALENDVENPRQSLLFKNYPKLFAIPGLIDFLCDYLRLMINGNIKPHELESLLEQELELMAEDRTRPANAVAHLADSLPGFGIVAAVLGVVITMQSLGGSPEELGAHIASALVGTFLGILLSYGLVGPAAASMRHQAEDQMRLFYCARSALIASANGAFPQISVEFARKQIEHHIRPSFNLVNAHLKQRGK